MPVVKWMQLVAGWETLMRARAVLLSAATIAALVGATGAHAQSRSLPKGSSLAATPPIDQRGKQFKALSRAQQLRYLHQGYRPHHHPY
jgi:hypothetical protein